MKLIQIIPSAVQSETIDFDGSAIGAIGGLIFRRYGAVMIGPRLPIFSSALASALFAAAGAASRNHFRLTETRWQIAAFAGAAGLIEMVLRAGGVRPSIKRFAFNAASAAAAITFTKFCVEPQALHADKALATTVVDRGVHKLDGKLPVKLR